MKNHKIAVFSAAIVSSLCGLTVSAQTFSYNPGDIFVAFRTAAGANNLIVDIGSASLYQNGTAPSTISGVNSTVLNSVFGSTDNIYWSVFGGISTTGSLGTAKTLWLSQPRSDASTQTDPIGSATASGQGNVLAKINAILNGTTDVSSTALSSSSVEVLSSLNVGGSKVSYTIGVGSLGNFNNTWTLVENNTGSGFSIGSTPSVNDLYEQDPGLANNGVYLGNLSLGNNGTLTYTSPFPEPSTWAMLGIGTIALIALRRQKTTTLKTN